MITGLNTFWIDHVKNIDIKSNEWPWSDEDWIDKIPKCITKVWMDPDVPRGFMMYRFVNLRDLVEGLSGSAVLISKLAVHPSWRNRGIGSELLLNLETAAKLQNVGYLILFVHEENVLGINWLRKQGFKAHRIHPGLSPDGRDSYSFMKELES